MTDNHLSSPPPPHQQLLQQIRAAAALTLTSISRSVRCVVIPTRRTRSLLSSIAIPRRWPSLRASIIYLPFPMLYRSLYIPARITVTCPSISN
eukprot:c48238_g1_i1 orf=22-300(-)